MKITKYEHACLFIQDSQGQTIVVDPGCFTKLPDCLEEIIGVIATEEHVDHFDLNNLKQLIENNPKLVVYSTSAVAQKLKQEDINSEVIAGESIQKIGSFTISFYETDHAPIYKVSPCKSLAVKINDDLYYPSDSYYKVSDPVKVLALPTGGPWQKINESVDFANQINASIIIPTHNGLYNDEGNLIANKFIATNLADSNRKFIYVKDGGVIEI